MLVKSKLKYIQTLGQKKFRDQDRVFIAEGPRLIEELLQESRVRVLELFAVNEWIEAHKKLSGGVNVTEITVQELERISQLTTPNKVLAIVSQFEPAAPLSTKGTITLALDSIRDPGNMGTILRIADWFGIAQVVCSPDSADIYNPKVVQSSMGSIARVRVACLDLYSWLLTQKETRVYATGLEGRDVTKMEKITEGIILIGNESSGLDPRLRELANVMVTIPRKGRAESLNAAIATGIILSHVV